jgi:signal transduction histidine kinase
MLKSIMRNLVNNAIKFTPRNGSIKLSANQLTGNRVEISVSDTGIGIPANILEKLFRLDGDVSRKGTEGESSTGLGLIICKDFIEKQEGEFWVESLVGKGSTFLFTLPGSKG